MVGSKIGLDVDIDECLNAIFSCRVIWYYERQEDNIVRVEWFSMLLCGADWYYSVMK